MAALRPHAANRPPSKELKLTVPTPILARFEDSASRRGQTVTGWALEVLVVAVAEDALAARDHAERAGLARLMTRDRAPS
jgi:hypothetical protein